MSKNLVVFVTPPHKNLCFDVVTFNLTTGNKVPRYTLKVIDLITFFDRPSTWIKTSVQAIVCDLCAFWKSGSGVDYNFCQHLATKFNALKIPFRFVTTLHITALLIAAKIDPEVDKEVLQIHAMTDKIRIFSLSRTENGYSIKKLREMPMCDDPKVLLKSSSNLSKIIIHNETANVRNTNVKALKSCLSKWNPIVLDEHISKYVFNGLKEIVDHMHGIESSKKYFVFPVLIEDLAISVAGENSSVEDILVFVEENTSLPLSKSCIVRKFHKQFYFRVIHDGLTSTRMTLFTLINKPGASFNILQRSQITKDGHRFKVSLSIDLNSFPTITHEPIILPKVKNMPKRINSENIEKLPIIGFFDNSSVICIWNEDENCYKYLDSWNGKFGKDLFLDFMRPKPTLISSSTEVTSLSGAVYDLIKIMSMPPDNVKVGRYWKFIFTKDDENPFLLKFDTFENEKKAATPAFLMALILKEHIRAIRKEIGEKPKKLGFRLFDDFENVEARKRVEAGLQEACEMKKIACCFV